MIASPQLLDATDLWLLHNDPDLAGVTADQFVNRRIRQNHRTGGMLWAEAQEDGQYNLPEWQDHPEFVSEFINYLKKNKKIRKGSHNPERDQEILVAFIEDGGIRPRQLASKYGISRQAASKLIARLKPVLARLYLDYSVARKARSNSPLYPCPHVQTEPPSEVVADWRGAS